MNDKILTLFTLIKSIRFEDLDGIKDKESLLLLIEELEDQLRGVILRDSNEDG